MLENKERWVGYLVNKYPHMNNRSTNRVEGTHAAQKHYTRTSSGKIALVTEKLNQWERIRVSTQLLVMIELALTVYIIGGL